MDLPWDKPTTISQDLDNSTMDAILHYSMKVRNSYFKY